MQVVPVLIVGGGLAGLTAAIDLAKKGLPVRVLERRSYPRNQVCGEYISNEVRTYLADLGFDPADFGATEISQFRFSSPKGYVLDAPLDLGGFGLRRYSLDNALYQLAESHGCEILTESPVAKIVWNDDENLFRVVEKSGNETLARVVIGAYGKRSRIDHELDRTFSKKSSAYLAVKYHIRYNFPQGMIALHNFKNGYCGISSVDGDQYCLCYLTHRSNLKDSGGNLHEMENKILAQNPHLRDIFHHGQFLYSKPEVINEISFERKKPVEQHILMAGDTSGMIAPMCGNGMSMAIHAGKIAAEEISDFFTGHQNRSLLETRYGARWSSNFGPRLWIGRNVQRLFGDVKVSEFTMKFFRRSPLLLSQVIRLTHGTAAQVGRWQPAKS